MYSQREKNVNIHQHKMGECFKLKEEMLSFWCAEKKINVQLNGQNE